MDQVLSQLVSHASDSAVWMHFWDIYVNTFTELINDFESPDMEFLKSPVLQQASHPTHKQLMMVRETGNPANQPLSPPLSTSQSPKQDINPFDGSYAVNVPPLPKSAFRTVKENNRHVFECTVPDCNKRFTRRAENAKAHWLLHHKITPFICSCCGIGFRRKHDLKRHLAAAHRHSGERFSKETSVSDSLFVNN